VLTIEGRRHGTGAAKKHRHPAAADAATFGRIGAANVRKISTVSRHPKPE